MKTTMSKRQIHEMRMDLLISSICSQRGRYRGREARRRIDPITASALVREARLRQVSRIEKPLVKLAKRVEDEYFRDFRRRERLAKET